MTAHAPHRALARVRARAGTLVVLAAVLVASSGACRRNANEARAVDPARAEIEAAVTAFLKQRGDLCLGKSVWPIQVTDHEVALRTSDAVQMPVLERLGLVRSTQRAGIQHPGEPPSAGRSYALTDLGRRFYRGRGAPRTGGDLCAGKVELDRIVAVQPQGGAPGEHQVVVRYTYHFAAAEWVHDTEVQAVFPMLARIVAGERALAMELRFRRTQAGWVVLDPRA